MSENRMFGLCKRCGARPVPTDLVAVIRATTQPHEHVIRLLIHATLGQCLSPEDTVLVYGQVLADGRRIRWFNVQSQRSPFSSA